ncbi:hypothetical protein WJU23_00340 [Prosthecobacter sp. SYSU 5D2]|uniref:hypothetical protein n=1 Tax=Prosthecobacter sp. SYSU 5D2 TaxID=3134134 RepID=UPI0031FE93E5
MAYALQLICLCLVLIGTAVGASPELPAISHAYLDSRGYPMLEITNRSPKSVSYSGYSAANLLFTIELLKEGKWVNADPGWCGNDVEFFELKPGSSTTVILLALEEADQPGNTIRLGFRFLMGAESEWTEKTPFYFAWSPPITFPLKPKS